MITILICLILAILFLGRRVFTIYRFFSNNGDQKVIQISLSWKFFLEETIGLFVVSLFLIAMSPVPAVYAIAAVFGIFLDLIISIYYYSIRAMKSSNKITVTA